jgi:hypothetical protein
MALVVNELETMYGDQAAFSRVDALTPLGKQAYEFYDLRGHPIIAILDEQGQLLAQIWGERPRPEVEVPLQKALNSGGRDS